MSNGNCFIGFPLNKIVYGQVIPLWENNLKEAVAEGGSGEKIAIFYSPHPDDETLSMGSAILHHLELGEEVHLVLLTQGGASGAFERVNERLREEGLSPITIEAFMEARVAEFKHAVYALGIDPEHIHLYDETDGDLNSHDVEPVILEMEKRFPKAAHYVFSYKDPHPDHAATGKALQKLYEANKVDQAGFFVPKYAGLDLGEPVYAPEDRQVFLQAALSAYGIWNPESGRYAVDHLSIIKAFEQAETARYDLMHG